MNKKMILSVVMAVILTAIAIPSSPAMAGGKELVIADFDAGDKPNNIGGDFGAWDKDPGDGTQGTKMSFASDDALGNPLGHSIRLDYDVDSSNPAYNGFWMKLNGEDAGEFNALTFYIKGDAAKGFSKRVKIELKDQGSKTSAYMLGNITEAWRKISIPFEKFNRITDWSALSEFVVVFDDLHSMPKNGAVLIDQIAFSKE
ncbi:MAG TPA: carbohydrate binding domain-containing protein [Candidatus Omnitrophota bacterium]|nr:carbohydrate binding domain-containing protein [Candidatus Omnitrophota bacterium]